MDYQFLVSKVLPYYCIFAMKLSIDIQRPETGIRLTENGTQVYINNESKGSGTLFVTEQYVIFYETFLILHFIG